MADADDKALQATIDRALTGDGAAFESLIRQYARLVYAQAFMLLHDHQDSEDVVQETFLRAYRFRVRLRDPARFRNWLLSIARNLARDLLRKRHPERFVPAVETEAVGQVPDADAHGPQWQWDLEESRLQLAAGLAALPWHHRTALALRYIEGLDGAAVARAMGVSRDVLRGILGRALAGLRQRLRRGDREQGRL